MKFSTLLSVCTFALGASAGIIPRFSKRAPVSTDRLPYYATKPRVFILSDISNEPDDQESLVRFLTYSNQFDVQGIVAVTSTWRRADPDTHSVYGVLDAYAEVVDNLQHHTNPLSPYPSADYLRSIVRSGPNAYGFEAVGPNMTFSGGSQLLLDRILDSSEPLWITVWGGTNVLAQVLYQIDRVYPEAEAALLRSRLRVYSISDQDDTGAWIRATYPDIFYIASVHAFNYYGDAAWTGISGETYYGFDQGGPDSSLVTRDWIRRHIQIGPLGARYGTPAFIPEGDTPSFLYLIQNGLNSPEHPQYGSWGGRYNFSNPSTIGFPSQHYGDVADQVLGLNGEVFRSTQATIWRWRPAYQNDFAARMQWTLTNDTSAVNHEPVVGINGTLGLEPVELSLRNGSSLVLNAEGTYDPDNDTLTYDWWQYREATATMQWNFNATVPLVDFAPSDSGRSVEVTMPWNATAGQVFHVILEVTDSGTPPLTSYRRVLITAEEDDEE